MKHKQMLLLVLILFGAAILFSQTPCLDFDGTNDYAIIPDDPSLNPTTVTVEGWLYLNSVTSRPHIIGKGISSTGSYWLVIETTRKPRFYHTVGNSGIWQSVEGSSDVPLNQWFHIAGTYNGTTASIYINGTQTGSRTANPSGNLKTNDTNPLYIARAYQNPPALFVDGMIDEVRIWNYARTSTQINDNMDTQLSGSQPGLLGYWQMNENSGSTLYDSSGNDNDGTIYGAAWSEGPETLPVELSSFTAIITSQFFVQLHWVTQSETDALGYMIYRSQDNDLEHAILVSPLINATNTTTQVSYEYTDSEVTPGTWYYWLQSLDLSGNFNFHGPILATVSTEQGGDAPPIPTSTGISKIYPNPFNPSVTIKYELIEAMPVSFQIYNTRGQIVKSYDLGTREADDSHVLVWDAAGLSTGVYLIRMQAGNKIYNSKAVLAK